MYSTNLPQEKRGFKREWQQSFAKNVVDVKSSRVLLSEGAEKIWNILSLLMVVFVSLVCQVPAGCRCLKVQAWGAGGGSGHFQGGQCGDGGGGAFAEALIYVTPEEGLEVCVFMLP